MGEGLKHSRQMIFTATSPGVGQHCKWPERTVASWLPIPRWRQRPYGHVHGFLEIKVTIFKNWFFSTATSATPLSQCNAMSKNKDVRLLFGGWPRATWHLVQMRCWKGAVAIEMAEGCLLLKNREVSVWTARGTSGCVFFFLRHAGFLSCSICLMFWMCLAQQYDHEGLVSVVFGSSVQDIRADEMPEVEAIRGFSLVTTIVLDRSPDTRLPFGSVSWVFI